MDATKRRRQAKEIGNVNRNIHSFIHFFIANKCQNAGKIRHTRQSALST